MVKRNSSRFDRCHSIFHRGCPPSGNQPAVLLRSLPPMIRINWSWDPRMQSHLYACSISRFQYCLRLLVSFFIPLFQLSASCHACSVLLDRELRLLNTCHCRHEIPLSRIILVTILFAPLDFVIFLLFLTRILIIHGCFFPMVSCCFVMW